MYAEALRISTLLYCFNEAGEVLLMHRNRSPNQGLWSPPGGKLHKESGESPHACAAREAREEIGIKPHPTDFSLKGIISEKGYEGEHHWLMFLFEYKHRLLTLPPEHPEGTFEFFQMNELMDLAIPHTDKAFIWPLFKKHRNGFFTVECECNQDGTFKWSELESKP